MQQNLGFAGLGDRAGGREGEDPEVQETAMQHLHLRHLQRNDETVRQLREEHNKYFKNEDYWNVLKTAIALNVDCTITKFHILLYS